MYVPPRLTTLLGLDLRAMTETSLGSLIGIREDADLDFKQEPYGSLEDFTEDVAAMANSQGGLIVIGVEEQDERASALSPIVLDAREELRLRQSVGDRVAPAPELTIKEVPNAADPATGHLLISVPPSPLAPHAVRRGNDRLRYLERNGPSNRPLTESEVADRYRARFRRAAEQRARLEELQRRGLQDLPFGLGDTVFLLVSLAPARPGRMRLNDEQRARVEAWLRNRPVAFHTLAAVGNNLGVPPVGLRYFRVSDSEVVAHLYDDGSGFVGAWVGNVDRAAQALSVPDPGSELGYAVRDDELTGHLLNALQLLGGAAVELTKTGGDADVRAGLLLLQEADAPTPRMVLVSSWETATDNAAPGTRVVTRPEPTERTVLLEDLVTVSPNLLVAGWPLLADMVRQFGQVEPLLVRQDGSFVSPPGLGQREECSWARMHGIPVVTE